MLLDQEWKGMSKNFFKFENIMISNTTLKIEITSKVHPTFYDILVIKNIIPMGSS